MVEGLDNRFTGAFFAGYHAQAGQKGAMAHSMIFAVRTMWINDIEVGELSFNAYIAGDDCACREAEVLIPHVTTAAVKQSLTRSAVRTMHPKKAHQLLQERTVCAIENRENVKPQQIRS